jgi:hypothetical protein
MRSRGRCPTTPSSASTIRAPKRPCNLSIRVRRREHQSNTDPWALEVESDLILLVRGDGTDDQVIPNVVPEPDVEGRARDVGIEGILSRSQIAERHND